MSFYWILPPVYSCLASFTTVGFSKKVDLRLENHILLQLLKFLLLLHSIINSSNISFRIASCEYNNEIFKLLYNI